MRINLRMYFLSGCLAVGFSTSLMLCKHVNMERSNTASNESSTAVEDRSEAIHNAVLKAVSSNEQKKDFRDPPAWFNTSVELNENWIIQSPENYWGRDPNSLPKKLACVAGESNCDPQFLRRLCSTNNDCVDLNAVCQELNSSVYEFGQKPKSMCLGSGDKLLDRFYDVMTSAERELDITTLSLPTNRFYQMTVNALTRIALANKKVSVRILLSGVETHSININNLPSGLLTKLIADMKIRASSALNGRPLDNQQTINAKKELIDNLQIEMKYLSKAFALSWNHAKIIVADQQRAIQGGHNFYDPDYLDDRPVFDLSMQYQGEAVSDTTSFINRLWYLPYDIYTAKNDRYKDIGPRQLTKQSQKSSSSVPAIAVGRLGSYGDDPSDRAFIALIKSAKHTIDIAQEDVFSRIPLGLNNYKVTASSALPHLVDAVLEKQVRLRIVQSDQESFAGYGMMGLPESHARIVKALLDRAKEKGIIAPRGETLRYYVCTLFEHAPWRFTKGEPRWAKGEKEDADEKKADKLRRIGSHPKLLLIDGSSFYLGSHNFYPADLQEFGLVISSVTKTKEIQAQYWDKIWNASAPDKADCGDKRDENISYFDTEQGLLKL